MTGEERDRAEHHEALKKFGGKMPFSPTYTPSRCVRHYERSNSEGNLAAESVKWIGYLEEAFGEKIEEPKSRRLGARRPDGKNGGSDARNY